MESIALDLFVIVSGYLLLICSHLMSDLVKGLLHDINIGPEGNVVSLNVECLSLKIGKFLLDQQDSF